MSHYDANNVFAQILHGNIPCEKIYEDYFALAFYDIHPQAPVHVLIIPKGSYISAQDFNCKASDEEICGFYRAISRIAEQFDLTEKGYRLVSNVGVLAGQEIPHFHIHLLGGNLLGPMMIKSEN